MAQNDKPTQNPPTPPNTNQTPDQPPPAKEKKKLTLDVTDVSEVLERKISP